MKKKAVKKTVVMRRRVTTDMKLAVATRFNLVPGDLSAQQRKDCETIRAGVKDLATLILRDTMPGRSQAVALTNLEQTLFWALNAITKEKDNG